MKPTATRELIHELKPATKARRRLPDRKRGNLTIRMRHQCNLVRWYRIQAGALMSVSTVAAVLLVIIAVVRNP